MYSTGRADLCMRWTIEGWEFFEGKYPNLFGLTAVCLNPQISWNSTFFIFIFGHCIVWLQFTGTGGQKTPQTSILNLGWAGANHAPWACKWKKAHVRIWHLETSPSVWHLISGEALWDLMIRNHLTTVRVLSDNTCSRASFSFRVPFAMSSMGRKRPEQRTKPAASTVKYL